MLKTLTALNRARYASQVAAAWYDKLWQAYINEEFRLHTNYDGLMLSSIFDAKPTAYRARAVEQFDFGFPEEHTYDFDGPDEWEDPLQGYYKAYLAEKEAWSIYTACYSQLVDEMLQSGVTPKRNDTKHAEYPAGRIRVLEVKPCK